jgi:hypothetical protein
VFASSSSLLLYFACIDNNNSVYHDDTYSAFVKSEDICIWRDLYIYISFVIRKQNLVRKKMCLSFVYVLSECSDL